MLETGTKAPDFTLNDKDGNAVSLADFAGKKVVLYFYPKDNTPGCTRQACAFAAAYEDFKTLDAVVIGVSKDSEASHRRFAEKNGLSPDVLDMVIVQTVKILMARTANSLPEAPFDPARKTCPYCGGKPELSVVHEKEGHRSLFCTDCGRHWRFQRTACPSCGCDKPDNLRLHFAESTPDERAVSCKNCGHYILEADIRKRDLALDGAAIVCLGMGYLDALMQEQGLLPLGESA